MSLAQLKQALNPYDLSKEEAHLAGVCIRCKLGAEPRNKTAAGEREHRISGLCEILMKSQEETKK